MFYLDYDCADLIYDRHFKRGGNRWYISLSYLLGLKGYYMDDLKSLYYILIYLAGVKLPWKRVNELAGIRFKRKFNDVRVSNNNDISLFFFVINLLYLLHH